MDPQLLPVISLAIVGMLPVVSEITGRSNGEHQQPYFMPGNIYRLKEQQLQDYEGLIRPILTAFILIHLWAIGQRCCNGNTATEAEGPGHLVADSSTSTKGRCPPPLHPIQPHNEKRHPAEIAAVNSFTTRSRAAPIASSCLIGPVCGLGMSDYRRGQGHYNLPPPTMKGKEDVPREEWIPPPPGWECYHCEKYNTGGYELCRECGKPPKRSIPRYNSNHQSQPPAGWVASPPNQNYWKYVDQQKHSPN